MTDQKREALHPTEAEVEAAGAILDSLMQGGTSVWLPADARREVARDLLLAAALVSREEPHTIEIVDNGDTFRVGCSCGWSDIRFTRCDAELKGSKHLFAFVREEPSVDNQPPRNRPNGLPYGFRLRPYSTYGQATERPVRLYDNGWLYADELPEGGDCEAGTHED